MSWSILSDEAAKIKREKKRKRKIKRGSQRGRYVVLGSRGRKGRKSAIHCTTCGRTLGSNYDGLVCTVCAGETEEKVKKHMSVPQMSHQITPQFTGGQTIEKKMSIPKMTGDK